LLFTYLTITYSHMYFVYTFLLLLRILPPPLYTLFPYTTLFRSAFWKINSCLTLRRPSGAFQLYQPFGLYLKCHDNLEMRPCSHKCNAVKQRFPFSFRLCFLLFLLQQPQLIMQSDHWHRLQDKLVVALVWNDF